MSPATAGSRAGRCILSDQPDGDGDGSRTDPIPVSPAAAERRRRAERQADPDGWFYPDPNASSVPQRALPIWNEEKYLAQTHMFPRVPGPELRPAVQDGMAVAALVLSLLWLGGLGSLLAMVFAAASNAEARRNKRRLSGMARVAMVLGRIGLAAAFLLAVAVLTIIHDHNGSGGA